MSYQVEIGGKADAQLAKLDTAIGAGVERKIQWLVDNATGMVHRRHAGGFGRTLQAPRGRLPHPLLDLSRKKIIRIYRIQHRSEVYRHL